jgi:hypothetical protein
MYWLRNWTATENYHWKQQGLAPIAPFPYKPFKDRRIDLSLLPYPHEFTQDDLPDYLDVLMGFFLFARDLLRRGACSHPTTRLSLVCGSFVEN